MSHVSRLVGRLRYWGPLVRNRWSERFPAQTQSRLEIEGKLPRPSGIVGPIPSDRTVIWSGVGSLMGSVPQNAP